MASDKTDVGTTMTPSPVAQGETARTLSVDDGDDPVVIGDTAVPAPTLVDALRCISEFLALDPTEEGQHSGILLQQAANHIETLERELQQARAEAEQARERALEEAARVCEKRAERRFEEHGYTEPDTNAGYYVGEWKNLGDSLDEEDADCAAAIRALKPSALDAAGKEGKP